jgi:hypothetical protein
MKEMRGGYPVDDGAAMWAMRFAIPFLCGISRATKSKVTEHGLPSREVI